MMTNERKRPSKTSIDALSAISRYRHQRRSGRVWVIGGRRISTTTVASLEKRAYVKEIALHGTPLLVLTDEGRRLVSSR